jgi:hypothetical protein
MFFQGRQTGGNVHVGAHDCALTNPGGIMKERTSEHRKAFIRKNFSLTFKNERWVARNGQAFFSGYSKASIIEKARTYWGHFNYRDEAEEFDKIFPFCERDSVTRKMYEKEKALLRLTLNNVAMSLDKQVEMLIALVEMYPGLESHEEFAPFDLEEAAEKIRTLRDKYV